jgi:hypothetical protein
MRSAADPSWARLAAAEALTLGPAFIFSRLVGAEGPLWLLLAWEALTVFLVFLARRPTLSRPFRIAVRAAAGLVALAGLGTVLLQVNVARRSLAEAWLDLAAAAGPSDSSPSSPPKSTRHSASARAPPPAGAVRALGARRRGGQLPLRGNRPGAAHLAGGELRFRRRPLPGSGGRAPFPPAQADRRPRGGGPGLGALAHRRRRLPRGVPLVPRPDFSELVSRTAPGFPLLRDVPGYASP